MVFVLCSKVKMITCHCLTADCSQLLLGTDGGSVYVFDTQTFTLTDSVILQDLILQKWVVAGLCLYLLLIYSFSLPRQQCSLLKHLWTAHGHCGTCKKLWNRAATDLCPCGEKQTMSHVVESCPLTKLNGVLAYRQLHSVAWLTSYGYWYTCKKKKIDPWNIIVLYFC